MSRPSLNQQFNVDATISCTRITSNWASRIRIHFRRFPPSTMSSFDSFRLLNLWIMSSMMVYRWDAVLLMFVLHVVLIAGDIFIKVPADAVEVDLTPLTTFKNLSKGLQMGILNCQQVPRPTRIQSTMIPLIANEPRVSLLAQCRRTLERDQALVLGVLQHIDQDLSNPTPQAIVFSPNGDVATKFSELVVSMTQYTPIQSALFAPYQHLDHQLSSDVVCGTFESMVGPVMEGILDTSQLKVIVVDEMDYMLLCKTPEQRSDFLNQFISLLLLLQHKAATHVQLLIVCTAYGDLLKTAISRLMIPGQYNSLYCNGEEREFSNVRHEKVLVNSDSKLVIAGRIIEDMIVRSEGILSQVIVYVNEVTEPTLLHEHLIKWRLKTPRLAPADQRDDYLVDFRAGRGDVLITSERFPLGFDESEPVGVIFFDIPTVTREGSEPEPDYSLFHHIAGRAGKSDDRIGCVVTLLDKPNDFHLLDNIQDHFDFQASQVDRYGVKMIF